MLLHPRPSKLAPPIELIDNFKQADLLHDWKTITARVASPADKTQVPANSINLTVVRLRFLQSTQEGQGKESGNAIQIRLTLGGGIYID